MKSAHDPNEPIPRPGAAVRSIFLDHSGYHLANVGDAAMLQAAVTRLQERFPGTAIHVVTYFRDRLQRLCPTTVPIYSRVHDVAHRLQLPKKVEYAALQLHKIVSPRLLGIAPWARRWRAPGDATATRDLLPAIAGADLVVAGGGGYFTDAFRLHALGILSTLEMAQALGKPTALMGQGIGPLSEGRFEAHAGQVLRRADVIGLREGLTGPKYMERWNVPQERWFVTGDDAIETAYALKDEQDRDALGVNVRAASYAGLSTDDAATDAIGLALRRVAAELDAPLVAVPISYHREDADIRSIRTVVGTEVEAHETIEVDPLPVDVMRQVARCRIVVTGSYHAAVFALSQGAPAVCLTKSGYYDVKFSGLRNDFGEGCQIVRLDDPQLESTLRRVATEAWERAADLREPLLTAAEGYIASGRAAYDSLVTLAAG